MDKLIDKAKQYIKDNNALVEIKVLAAWKQQGIIRRISKHMYSEFIFDKVIEFADGTIETIWI